MRLGFGEILVVLALALLFFGPSKLPALEASLGEAIHGFKHGLTSVGSEPEGPPSSQRAGNEATGSSQSTVGVSETAQKFVLPFNERGRYAVQASQSVGPSAGDRSPAGAGRSG